MLHTTFNDRITITNVNVFAISDRYCNANSKPELEQYNLPTIGSDKNTL